MTILHNRTNLLIAAPGLVTLAESLSLFYLFIYGCVESLLLRVGFL